jgi:hypothetical protein
VRTRILVGRTPVVGAVRAAAPLMAALRAPVPARAPWLTAVLDQDRPGRPAAVVLEPGDGRPPEAAAFLRLRRRGLGTRVTLLADGVGPVPEGLPTARLLARDERSAGLLAAGIRELLDGLRGPHRMRLAGLPLGDPTARLLAAARPDALLATGRTRVTVDALGDVGAVRTRDPHEIGGLLPAVLSRAPDDDARSFLESCARLHAATGQLEVAVVPGTDGPRAGLLTLVDGAVRLPWWGWSDVGGLGEAMGAPAVTLTDPAGRWP